MSKSPFQRLLSVGKNFYHQLFKLPGNPHLVGRDHTHLQKNYRRSFTAPDSIHPQLSKMLIGDAHFIDALEMHRGETLVRVAIVGDYLHANLYVIGRFSSGPLWPLYNTTWRDDAIADFRTSPRFDTFEADKPNGVEFIPVVRHLRTDQSYDYYEPYASYFRPLSEEELVLLSTTTRPHWRH